MYISFVQRKNNMIEGSSRATISIRDECLVETHINTIFCISNLIEGSGRAYILLPEGTKLIINDALYSSKFRRNLLSFKDIRRNSYHIETMTKNNIENLQIKTIKYGQKIILQKMKALSSGLYCTNISSI
jgi:hypothetical protein